MRDSALVVGEGYYFSRPLAVDAMGVLLREHRRIVVVGPSEPASRTERLIAEAY